MPRAGFTLIEMLLALAVLVLAATIMWPPARAALDAYQLKRTASAIRTEIASTRVKAIDSGLTWQFLFEPAGRNFLLMPAEAPPVYAGTVTTAGAPATAIPMEVGQLPDGLSFAGLTGQELTQQLPSTMFGIGGAASQLSSVTWSEPLLFYSDGTASGGGLYLLDAKGRGIAIAVRGLTGAVETGPVERRAVQ